MKVIATEKVPIKVWAESIEEGAIQQARNLANLPSVYKWVALMPDCHVGYGIPIGGVIATTDLIIPNAVGVDIGCGIAAVSFNCDPPDTDELKRIMGEVRKDVPVGFSHHQERQQWAGFDAAPDLPIIQQELDSARKQLGTLGGGNHFIEFQLDDAGRFGVMLHSERWHVELPDRELAFLSADSQEGQDYLTAMQYCLDFAQANRAHMLAAVLRIVGLRSGGEVNIHHNYAAIEHHFSKNVWVHRKGATRARTGELGIIPGSMGTASYIVEGLGNPESFQSCSHGAGRRMGRKQAERTLDLAAEQAKMGHVIHGLRNVSDLDEAPGAYKDIDAVMAAQNDLVRIVSKRMPLGSIKG
jgi:tRNA-splicing ligase RtcB